MTSILESHEIKKRAKVLYEDELHYAIERDDEVDIPECRAKAARRLGQEMDGQDVSSIWAGYVEGIAKGVERGFEVDLAAGEIRIGGVLRTGSLRLVPADKCHETDLLEWDALREQKYQEFGAKRAQERPMVDEAVGRMREMGGNPTLIQACPEWFAEDEDA